MSPLLIPAPGEAQVPFFEISGAEFVEMIVGEISTGASEDLSRAD
jgi:ATP-dependent Zn protease